MPEALWKALFFHEYSLHTCELTAHKAKDGYGFELKFYCGHDLNETLEKKFSDLEVGKQRTMEWLRDLGWSRSQ